MMEVDHPLIWWNKVMDVNMWKEFVVVRECMEKESCMWKVRSVERRLGEGKKQINTLSSDYYDRCVK